MESKRCAGINGTRQAKIHTAMDLQTPLKKTLVSCYCALVLQLLQQSYLNELEKHKGHFIRGDVLERLSGINYIASNKVFLETLSLALSLAHKRNVSKKFCSIK